MARDPHPFYVPHASCDETSRTIRFPAEEAHHILHVIRLKTGEECRVTDGMGGLFRVVLEKRGDDLDGRILGSFRASRPRVRLEIGFPILRLHARNDWLIEKAVEVGADRLIPIPWQRSTKEPTESMRRRWERIAREAMKQSERLWLPEIAIEPSPFVRSPDTLWILADPKGGEATPALPDVDRVRLHIGPEGGLTDAERDHMVAQGAVLWGLGPSRLRAETAAITGAHRLSLAIRELRPRIESHSNGGA